MNIGKVKRELELLGRLHGDWLGGRIEGEPFDVRLEIAVDRGGAFHTHTVSLSEQAQGSLLASPEKSQACGLIRPTKPNARGGRPGKRSVAVRTRSVAARSGLDEINSCKTSMHGTWRIAFERLWT
jgi:hypothetical protein